MRDRFDYGPFRSYQTAPAPVPPRYTRPTTGNRPSFVSVLLVVAAGAIAFFATSCVERVIDKHATQQVARR